MSHIYDMPPLPECRQPKACGRRTVPAAPAAPTGPTAIENPGGHVNRNDREHGQGGITAPMRSPLRYRPGGFCDKCRLHLVLRGSADLFPVSYTHLTLPTIY